MFQFETDDIIAVLRKSSNSNSAIKNFLKKQSSQDPASAKFAKDLRELLASSNEKPLRAFLDKNLDRFSSALVAIGAYSHTDFVNSFSSEVVEKYADDFNTTYLSKGKEVEIKDEEKFFKIWNEVDSIIGARCKEYGCENSEFLRSIVLNAIFEPEVLAYAMNDEKEPPRTLLSHG